jgi:SagB-type dehydrogenase family enzyme
MADESLLALPQPRVDGGLSLTEALLRRRTVRDFGPQSLSLDAVGQLLWAAQGITSEQGYRTAPSAGALYPLELHLIAGRVNGLPAGAYRYVPSGHRLRPTVTGDLRPAVADAALDQDWIARAPALVVVSAVPSRTTRKYGRRGHRYVHMEVGHASQNLLLEAVALGLAGAIVGAFDDDRLGDLLALPRGEEPLVILPVGHLR